MRRRTALALALMTIASLSHSNQDALQSMVDAERAFARTSVERGMRDAFLENMAGDGIVFQPFPVNARQVWEPRPKSPATLIWEPAFAEVAASGDLGYTVGPWELRPPAEAGRPAVYGHFHSVWRRESDGAWKVAVDIGGAHEKTDPGVGSGAFTAGPVHPKASRGDRRRAAGREVLAAEKRFAEASTRGGFAGAFAAVAARDVRLGRDGIPPAIGLESARGALAVDVARSRWTPQGSGASRAGDLGYAYGVRERLTEAGAVADSAAFLHVWRREPRGWRLALIVDNPVARR